MLKRIRELLGRRDPSNAGRPSDPATPELEPPGDRPSDGTVSATPEPPPVQVGPRAVHQPIDETDLDEDAVKIVRRLARFDHIAYLVGGCVRDLLLERTPKDFDIGTSATPRQVKRLFRNCRIIGRRFRLAHIYFQNGKIIEVATFRALESDDDGATREDDDLMIRDDNVFGTPEEDALRRDFTINQLFYDLGSQTVLDHAGGLDDLRRRVVRTIGDPDVRFREDPIRILRAIKFAARLDFRIEPGTAEALTRARSEIPKAAPPRVLEEIYRFCRSGAAVRSFDLLRETSVFAIVFPELADVYAGENGSVALLDLFLARFDRAFAAGEDVPGGEILAALVLPAVIEPLGWSATEGTAVRPRGVDVRRVVDEHLRPLALRLRVSRRDQEHARQLIATVHRMVPARRLRGNARRGLLSRSVFGEALGWLELLGERIGGDFAAAHAYWKEAAAGRADEPEREDTGESAEPGPGGGRRRRGRRGRRGGRSRRSESRERSDVEASDQASPAKPRAAASKRAQDLPPVWDDRYFFAALPTVPDGIEQSDTPEPEEDGATADGTDRDGSGGEASTTSGERPRRRRRRGGRGRGRGRGRSQGTDEASSTDDPGGDPVDRPS